MQTRQYLFGMASGSALLLAASQLAQMGLINWSLAVVAALMIVVSGGGWCHQWVTRQRQHALLPAQMRSPARGRR
ncbi:hypothetical protein [Ferrimonas aestuarii]|uniref:Uncharacterized protein n=1 Tax=Ferrimonas aestuarii TaxID=2569539 RepID=A0A4U1BNV9_9GAMM|nr:hypothetical protein [Ferrimonas aestuarii]TKB56055.1 hypothetical protein FCL42_07510 [Ferrimonas aestuarii]